MKKNVFQNLAIGTALNLFLILSNIFRQIEIRLCSYNFDSMYPNGPNPGPVLIGLLPLLYVLVLLSSLNSSTLR